MSRLVSGVARGQRESCIFLRVALIQYAPTRCLDGVLAVYVVMDLMKFLFKTSHFLAFFSLRVIELSMVLSFEMKTPSIM